jgi:hypothetical protein
VHVCEAADVLRTDTGLLTPCPFDNALLRIVSGALGNVAFARPHMLEHAYAIRPACVAAHVTVPALITAMGW